MSRKIIFLLVVLCLFSFVCYAQTEQAIPEESAAVKEARYVDSLRLQVRSANLSALSEIAALSVKSDYAFMALVEFAETGYDQAQSSLRGFGVSAATYEQATKGNQVAIFKLYELAKCGNATAKEMSDKLNPKKLD